MSKIEIELPFTGSEGMKEIRFHFRKIEDEFSSNTNVTLWVKEVDSISAMRTEGIEKLRIFLREMTASIDTEYPKS